MRALYIICGAWIFSWIYEVQIREFLTNRAINAMIANVPKDSSIQEVVHNAPEFFMIKMKVSFFLALLFAFPFLVLQVWAFVAPGLKPNEQRPFKRLAPLSLILFVIGGLFCWFILPSAFTWFVSYMPDFHKTILNEFYQVTFRRKIYRTIEELQTDLDAWLSYYNNDRTHQGKMCCGRTPMQTLIHGKEAWHDKITTLNS